MSSFTVHEANGKYTPCFKKTTPSAARVVPAITWSLSDFKNIWQTHS